MPSPSSATFQHEAMATFFEITIAGQEHDYARHAATAAFQEVDRLENVLSRFIESSDIARASRIQRGQTIAIGDDTLECLIIAADVALATGRAFDPTFASARSPDLAPDALPFTLDPNAHTLTSQTEHLRLDLGAVGKGYALDRIAALLRDWNITDACLNSGGSTALALGTATSADTGWPFGLGEGRAHRTIAVRDAALSGSGTAVKGSHLIDPRTGQPALRTNRTWALAASAAVSDALSTAFFVMTEADIESFCTMHPEIGAALVAPGEELVVHGALRSLFI